MNRKRDSEKTEESDDSPLDPDVEPMDISGNGKPKEIVFSNLKGSGNKSSPKKGSLKSKEGHGSKDETGVKTSRQKKEDDDQYDTTSEVSSSNDEEEDDNQSLISTRSTPTPSQSSGRFKKGGERGSPSDSPERKDSNSVPKGGTTDLMRTKKEYRSNLKRILMDTRFFLIKSNNAENVEIAQTQGVWSTPSGNESKLNQAFAETRNVILVFSVKESGKYSGFARLATESQRRGEAPQVNWKLPPGLNRAALGGIFSIDWISKNELNFDKVQHLFNPWNEGKPVKIGRDGQEIEPHVASELCRLFAMDFKTDWEAILKRSKDAKEKVVGSGMITGPLRVDGGDEKGFGSRGRGRGLGRGFSTGLNTSRGLFTRGRGRLSRYQYGARPSRPLDYGRGTRRRYGSPSEDDYEHRAKRPRVPYYDSHDYDHQYYASSYDDDRRSGSELPSSSYYSTSQRYRDDSYLDYTSGSDYYYRPPPMVPFMSYPPPPPFDNLPPPPPGYYDRSYSSRRSPSPSSSRVRETSPYEKSVPVPAEGDLRGRSSSDRWREEDRGSRERTYYRRHEMK